MTAAVATPGNWLIWPPRVCAAEKSLVFGVPSQILNWVGSICYFPIRRLEQGVFLDQKPWTGRLLWWCTCLFRPWQHCPTHSSLKITPPPRPFLVSYYAPILLERSWQCHITPTNVFTCFHWCFQQWWTILNSSKEIWKGFATFALYRNATRATREIRNESCVRTLENGC